MSKENFAALLNMNNKCEGSDNLKDHKKEGRECH